MASLFFNDHYLMHSDESMDGESVEKKKRKRKDRPGKSLSLRERERKNAHEEKKKKKKKPGEGGPVCEFERMRRPGNTDDETIDMHRSALFIVSYSFMQ